ncbi:tolloid-like protein 1 isoform X4 [Halichondria panicea]|uniref:tolloid-like protein 1 isoform X4 n=1 Tax=Halichondria panicea TaxID=6063 RepID=UPI00312B4027
MLQQIFITLLLIFHLASSTHEKSTDKNVEEVKDEFNGHFSDPSAKAAMIKHIGDMAFIKVPHGKNQSTDQTRTRRNAIRYSSALWPNAQVPYTISPDFSENDREVILQAMRHWEDRTCLRFFPRTTERYFIYILSGDGCYSYVGRLHRNYQPQGVSLGPGCVYLRTAIHEIGHAIGFYHEHTRHDRDQYVNVITNNIRNGQAGNFAKARPGQTLTLGYGYDYASIMHYTGTSFAKSRSNPTIVAKDEGIVFGSAQELSPLDILLKANALYRCGSTRPPISTYPQSTKALTLPDGITCGGVMEGKSGTFYSPSYPNHIVNQRCAWVIRVPEGYRVRLSFPGLRLEQSAGCIKDYVQVFIGRSINPEDGEYLSRNARDGKFCSSSQIYTSNYVYDNTATVYYHTDSSNTGPGTPRGLRVDFSTIDINECGGQSNRCHTCTNLDGSYRCECKNGYYHSPAASTCFDFNECAYDNGGCDHICDNTGGSYICKCNPGYYLQADGLSCTITPTAPPTVTPPTCGGALTSAIGTLQTPQWPETYPFNFDCE